MTLAFNQEHASCEANYKEKEAQAKKWQLNFDNLKKHATGKMDE